MEENKVASNSDLRERAFKTYRKLREIALNPAGVHVDSIEAIFREMVAVRNETIKKVLVYETDVAAYESYCVGRGDKP